MVKRPGEAVLQTNQLIVGLLGIITAIAVGFVLYQIRSIILPFAMAVFISFLLNPIISFFEERRVPTFLAIIFAIILTFVVLNFFGVLVYTSIKSFAAEFPRYELKLSRWVQEILRLLNIPPEIFAQQAKDSNGLAWINSVRDLSLHTLILNTLGSIVNFMSNTLLVLLFLLFILSGRNQLTKKAKLAFNGNMADKISTILTNVNAQIQKYIIAKTLISFTTGLLFAIVLTIFDVPFALIWGIMAFLLNFIPNIGSFIATILPLAIAIIQFNSLTSIIWLGAILAGIQFIIGNLLDPRVIGRQVNLSPLVVLFSLMFWGWLWGLIGMFLAVPIAVIIKIIFENIDGLRFISVLMSAK